MFKPHLIFSILLSTLLAFSTSLAQDQAPNPGNRPAAPATKFVTAYVAADRVRFAASSSVVQIRLEVYASNGEKLFDNEIKGGNVLDWHLQNGQAERLQDGKYLCVVTVKSLSGKLTQKIASVVVEATAVRLQPADGAQLTAQQAQAIGPLEEDSALIMLRDDEPHSGTVIAHNGEEGQITRAKGALSFRLGDIFSGKDREQMKLTAEGNLGIGITKPQVKLDVDGVIRASQGIMFPDGTIQTTAANVRGRNRIPDIGHGGKPIDQDRSSGKAGKDNKEFSPAIKPNGDLIINGNIIFTPSPQAFRDITVQNNNGGLRFYGAPTLTNSPAAAAIQFWGNNSPFQGQLYLDSGAHDNSAVIIRTTGTGGTIAERMRVTATGNVGVGTAIPSSPLDVAGAINTSTQYNIGGSRVLSVAGPNNTFAGVGAGTANSGSNNSFFGASAGLSNTSGNSNSFFGHSAGTANTTGSSNSFFGREAGRSNTTGVTNSFFGSFAGFSNSTGGANSFFGASAGDTNSTGNGNSFFGNLAGTANTSGSENSFFGRSAGGSNTTANNNSFFGSFAGFANTTGSSNSFFGQSAGAANTGGLNNSFFGASAGNANTTGGSNSFFGASSGLSNTTGVSNSFFGYLAGNVNTTGNRNSFFGRSAGVGNTTGSDNSFFGEAAGGSNTTGLSNSFFGTSAGAANTAGDNNSFFGRAAGDANTTASDNSFFGASAGTTNTTGVNNSFFGRSAGLANSTGSDNSFFGRSAGAANNTGGSNSFFGANAGDSTTTGGNNAFFGRSAGAANTVGQLNSYFGSEAGGPNTGGSYNAFFGAGTGSSNVGERNSFFGYQAGVSNTGGFSNTAIGAFADVPSGNVSFATAIGAGTIVGDSNQIRLGRDAGFDTVVVPGLLLVGTLGAASATHVCINNLELLSTCSSSLRYKTNLAPYASGLGIINRLRPITFDWKSGGMRDLGFGAEEVEKIDPLLVTYNKQGQVEGVKYDRISVVLVNALKEQQQQIAAQRDELREARQWMKKQQTVIDDLKRLVCKDHPGAEICK